MSPALATTFRSLRVRNYRLYASGLLVSHSGTWMQRVGQDWLVLELSGNSGTAVGIVTGLQFLPMLLFSLYAGVLADRSSKRALLMAAQVAMGLVAVALAVLTLSGAVALWHVYLLAFLLGAATAVDTPVRQSFVVELVGPRELPNAISLNSATFNSARVLGPAIGGVLIAAAGVGTVFALNAASYGAVLASLVLMRHAELYLAPRVARAKGQLREGVRYVRGRVDLVLPMVLVGVIGMVGLNFQLMLALVTKEVFDRGAASYGLLSAMLAVGSLMGALLAARRHVVRQRLLLGSAVAFGLLEMTVGLMPTFATMAIALVPTGMAILTVTTAANATVQAHSDSSMRGRVMAIYVLIFLGGRPLGGPLIGWLAEVFGARASLLIGGGTSALAAVVLGLLLLRHRGLRLEAALSRRQPFVRVRTRSSSPAVESAAAESAAAESAAAESAAVESAAVESAPVESAPVESAESAPSGSSPAMARNVPPFSGDRR